MAIKLMLREYRVWMDDYKHEYICDTDADLENLQPCGTGSTAVSLESGKVMVVNTQGKWVVFGEPSGGGSDSIVGTWQLNSALTRACPITAKIDFTTNNNHTNPDGVDLGNSFGMMRTNYGTTLFFSVTEMDGLNMVQVIGNPNGFINGFDGVIHITGGDDIANEEYVAWLKENATKIA